MNEVTYKRIVSMIDQIEHMLDTDDVNSHATLKVIKADWIHVSQHLLQELKVTLDQPIQQENAQEQFVDVGTDDVDNSKAVLDRIRSLIDSPPASRVLGATQSLHRAHLHQVETHVQSRTKKDVSLRMHDVSAQQKSETQRIRIGLNESWSDIAPQRLGIEYDHLGHHYRGVHNFTQLYSGVCLTFLTDNSDLFYQHIGRLNDHGNYVSYNPETFHYNIQIGRIYLNIDIPNDQIRQNILELYGAYKLDIGMFGLWVLHRTSTR